MSTMITRREFLQGAGVLAIGAAGGLLTGCGSVLMGGNTALLAGKYTVGITGWSLDGPTTSISGGHIENGEYVEDIVGEPSPDDPASIGIEFSILGVDDAIVGKKPSEVFTAATMDGEALTLYSTYYNEDEEDAIDEPEGVVKSSALKARYFVTRSQYEPFVAGTSTMSITVTLCGESAVFSFNYSGGVKNVTVKKQ